MRQGDNFAGMEQREHDRLVRAFQKVLPPASLPIRAKSCTELKNLRPPL